MRILDLNIGIKLDNGWEVVRLIEESNPSIVVLQEAMRGLEDSVFEQYNSANVIKKNTDYPYHFFGPLWIASHHEKNGGVISKNFGGLVEQGNYVLSRYEILSSSNVFYHQHYGEFTDTTNFRVEDHPRAFTETVIEVEGKKICLINVHGIWNRDKLGDERCIHQMHSILEEVKRIDLPTIIVGDFNLLPESEAISIMNKYFKNLITEFHITSTRPKFDDGLDQGEYVCDYIFVSDDISVVNFQVIDTDISDHLPLLLDFELKED